MKKYYFIFFIIVQGLTICSDLRFVSEIVINGNEVFSDLELEKIMRLKKPQLFSRSTFSKKILNKDILNIKSFYKSNGFLSVQIEGAYKEIDIRNTVIEINILEGECYYLNNINVSGNKLYENDWLNKFISIKINSPYNPTYVRKKIKELKNQYLNDGKLFINIIDEIFVEDNNVSIRLTIAEGKTYYLNNISIIGIVDVPEKFVTRELLIYKNDKYSLANIEKSRKRIFESGLFSLVEIFPENIDQEDGRVDLIVKVREYKSSSIEGQIGFNQIPSSLGNLPISAINLNLNWLIGNIRKSASNLGLNGSIGVGMYNQILFLNNNYELIYRTPWIYKYRIPMTIRYYYQSNTEDNNIIINGLRHSIEYKYNKYSKITINTILRFIRIDSTLLNYSNQQQRSFNIGYEINNVNNHLNPSGGYFFSFIPSLVGSGIDVVSNYIKLNLKYKKYKSYINNNVFCFQAQIGYIGDISFGLLDIDKIPFYDRYHLGGQTSLRGWSSPEDYNDDNQNGGLIMELLNVENRFNIYKNIGGTVFFDIGRLYSHYYESLNRQVDWNLGTGVTYLTTLGPIRIDVAFAYERNESKYFYENFRSPQYHASLLYMF